MNPRRTANPRAMRAKTDMGSRPPSGRCLCRSWASSSFGCPRWSGTPCSSSASVLLASTGDQRAWRFRCLKASLQARLTAKAPLDGRRPSANANLATTCRSSPNRALARSSQAISGSHVSSWRLVLRASAYRAISSIRSRVSRSQKRRHPRPCRVVRRRPRCRDRAAGQASRSLKASYPVRSSVQNSSAGGVSARKRRWGGR
jgi:hypothetical protein